MLIPRFDFGFTLPLKSSLSFFRRRSLMGCNRCIVLDIGTTGVKSFVFNERLQPIESNSVEVPVICDDNGKYEIDPLELLRLCKLSICEISSRYSAVYDERISCFGLTTQRGSILLWNKYTGIPYSNFITWNDTRLSKYTTTKMLSFQFTACERLGWLIKQLGDKCCLKEAVFGTVETWIAWNLTREKILITDKANSSLSGMMDIEKNDWDYSILSTSSIPLDILPSLVNVTSNFGFVKGEEIGLDYDIPLKCVIGDQQSSTIGCGCLKKGFGKVTIGTGTFIDINVGNSYMPLSEGINCYFGWNDRAISWYIAEIGASGNTAIFNKLLSDGVVEQIADINHITEDLLSLYENASDNKYVRVAEALELVAFKFRNIFSYIEKSSIDLKYPLVFDGNASKIDFLMKCIATLIGMPIRRGYSNSTSIGTAFLCLREIHPEQVLPPLHHCEDIFPVESETFKRKICRNYNVYLEGTRNEFRF